MNSAPAITIRGSLAILVSTCLISQHHTGSHLTTDAFLSPTLPIRRRSFLPTSPSSRSRLSRTPRLDNINLPSTNGVTNGLLLASTDDPSLNISDMDLEAFLKGHKDKSARGVTAGMGIRDRVQKWWTSKPESRKDSDKVPSPMVRGIKLTPDGEDAEDVEDVKGPVDDDEICHGT